MRTGKTRGGGTQGPKLARGRGALPDAAWRNAAKLVESLWVKTGRPEVEKVVCLNGVDSESQDESTDDRPLSPAPRPQHCRTFVRKELAKELPKICRKLTNDAATGSLQPLKQLWQMAGLDEEPVPAAKAGAAERRIPGRLLPDYPGRR